MDCLTPIRLPLGNRILLHDCGKCYACQNKSRGEWALRAREEIKSRPYVFFLTLTYDNDNLAKYCFNIRYNKVLKKYVNFDFDYNTGEIKDYVNDIFDPLSYVKNENAKNFVNRRWNFALLRKDHLQKFLIDINVKYGELFSYTRYTSEFQSIDYYYMGSKVKFKDNNTFIIKGIEIPLKNCVNGLYIKAGTLHKRVRTIPKYKSISKMKYYATGEYGDTTNRPHY